MAHHQIHRLGLLLLATTILAGCAHAPQVVSNNLVTPASGAATAFVPGAAQWAPPAPTSAAGANPQPLRLPKLEDEPPPSAALDPTPLVELLPPTAGQIAGQIPVEDRQLVPEIYRELTPRAFGLRVLDDYRNFYDCHTLGLLALGIGVAAPIANTNIDREFGEHYQDSVRNQFTDDLASFFKVFGEGKYMLPATAGLTAVYYMLPESPFTEIPGQWAEQSLRAYLVGGPPMYFTQMALGAGRPGESIHSSRWTPFKDNNAVSGHAFMGAVPFLTAANMTDRPVLKAGFYVLSTMTAWSRVNDNAHFLSQAALGWWFAFLATQAVHQTDEDARYRIVPMAMSDGMGMGVEYRF